MRNNMVRVISIHNFEKQDITSIDEVTDVAAVHPDLLLLAQPNNTILVLDLSLENDSGYTIPTVDQAVKIVYSIQGNYIAAVESKVTRNGTKVSYLRVYMNWESLKESKDSFPMRARIAGRVTPLSQHQQGLEMIEIPTQRMPDNVSCCSISGNLLVSSKNVLTIFNFVTQTHDISKIHFIDFRQLSVDLHLSFVPTRFQLLEDVIAVQNDDYMYVFRIKSAVPMCSLSDQEFSIDDFERNQSNCPKVTEKRKVIYYEKLVQEINEMRNPSNMNFIKEMKQNIHDNKESSESELSKVNILSFPIRHEFPSVILEKSLVSSTCPDVFRQNPFVITNNLSVNLVTNSSSGNSSKIQYKTIDICQYRLIPLTIGSITHHEMREKFTSLILKPYYSDTDELKPLKQRALESDHYVKLKCIACFFGTQQEGYLHSFEYVTADNEDAVNCGNYITYAFTAPVVSIQLDDCFVHALTESGLETYTMRPAKHILKITDSTTCPSCKDPVCLIGLHPFVNVLKMCITSNYLTLFANNEESSWTLYQLKSPGTPCIWKDFLTAAEENKWEAPATYCELLGEGHLILKTRLQTLRWISEKDKFKNQLCFAKIVSEEDTETSRLYNESCALLGDYHIINKNYQTCYCYYTMSGFKIIDIIKRIRRLWKDIPEKYRGSYDERDVTKGLIYFLKKTLTFYDQKYYEFAGNREEFYNSDIGNLVTNLMDLLEKEEEGSISDLVLESVVLREFSTDRILKMLKNLLSKSSTPQDKEALSLALMCIQRDQSDQAKTVLLTMSPTQLEVLLLQYYDLLFASHDPNGVNMFTELSMVLIEIYPSVLANVLSNLVTEKRVLSLSKAINFFMSIMPSGGIRSKNSSFVLQVVLENFFKYYAENFSSKKFDHKATEAIKILIRIYLMRLQQDSPVEREKEKDDEEEDESKILFRKHRAEYLSQIPPFGPEFSQMFLPPEEKSAVKYPENEQKKILLKIQCLLSFDGIPDDCLTEVRNFLSKQTNVYGSLSLQVLCATSPQEAITLLLDFAPQSLSRFAKERLKEKEDWKFIVMQLHQKANKDNEDSRHKFYFQQLLSEILHHIAENLGIEDVVEIIPEDYEDTDRYLALAQNNAQANHIRTLIMITGKQLLASLSKEKKNYAVQ